MARYDSGETLASIARTYDCSPPAISYVVSRSRTRQPDAETPPLAPSVTAPQLIKAATSEPAVGSNAQAPVAAPAPANGQPSDLREEIWPREANGFARNGAGEGEADLPGIAVRAAPPVQRPPVPHPAPGLANGDQRRTLHLSLGNAPQVNGTTAPAESHPAERQNLAGESQHAQLPFPQNQTVGESFTPPVNPEPQDRPPVLDRERDGMDGTGFPEARPGAYHGPVQRNDANVAPARKDGAGSYIDQELRARVDGDIAAFLAAFDAALAQDTQESRSALREATDRLLRAGARTRIELERLEARMPLPPRDNIGGSEPAWRHR